LPSNLVIAFEWKPKRGNITNLVLLVSVTQKDGQLKKIWSPSNHHNFSDGEQRFLITKKEGMPHVSENMSIKAFQKCMTTPFVATKKNFVTILKIMTIGWRLKTFNYHNLSDFAIENFQSPQRWVIKKIWLATLCGDQKKIITI